MELEVLAGLWAVCRSSERAVAAAEALGLVWLKMIAEGVGLGGLVVEVL
jgi:hypothetical protein